VSVDVNKLGLVVVAAAAAAVVKSYERILKFIEIEIDFFLRGETSKDQMIRK